MRVASFVKMQRGRRCLVPRRRCPGAPCAGARSCVRAIGHTCVPDVTHRRHARDVCCTHIPRVSTCSRASCIDGAHTGRLPRARPAVLHARHAVFARGTDVGAWRTEHVGVRVRACSARVLSCPRASVLRARYVSVCSVRADVDTRHPEWGRTTTHGFLLVSLTPL